MALHDRIATKRAAFAPTDDAVRQPSLREKTQRLLEGG